MIPLPLTFKPATLAEIRAEVMANARPNRAEDGKRVKRTLGRGKFGRRVIAEKVVDGVEHSYHATKGWRAVRKDWGGRR